MKIKNVFILLILLVPDIAISDPLISNRTFLKEHQSNFNFSYKKPESINKALKKGAEEILPRLSPFKRV